MALIFLIILTLSSTALASGWWTASNSGSNTDTVGSAYWRSFSGNDNRDSPHGGYVTTTNLCKVCHAVHEAGSGSYRLLKNGTTDSTRTQGELDGASYPPAENGYGNKRTSECMYCHDADAGVTSKKPYRLGAVSPSLVLGEHTLGATKIPDSTTTLPDRNPLAVDGRGAELDCYQCHSVHGANTIGFDYNSDGVLDPIAMNSKKYDSKDAVESWNNKILRVDPNRDGLPLSEGNGGITATETASQPTAVRTGFCGDCHNNNPNWVTTTNTVGPNKTSHIQGGAADGLMEVYGNFDVAVAAHTGETQGCRGCHAASDGNYIINDSTDTLYTSNFPHQSLGWKLMWDTYDDTGSVVKAGDPNRSLPNMDKVCLMCHPVDNEFETGKAYSDPNTEENLCFRCHSVSNPFGIQMDIKTQITKVYSHPTTRTPGLHSYDTTETTVQLGYNDDSPNNRHAECLDCHNMDTVVQGQRQPLRGMWGVQPSYSGAGAPTGYTQVSAVTKQYQLCFKCHSSYVTRRPDTTYSGPVIYQDSLGNDLGQKDKALLYNPNNNSFHPVEGPGRNQSDALNNTLIGGLNRYSTIKCIDCHNSDDTSDTVGSARNDASRPQGAHGSDYRPLLRANYRLDLSSLPTTYDSGDFDLCFLCHDENKLLSSTATDTTNFYNPYLSSSKRNLHLFHLKKINSSFWAGGYATCRICHYNAHSNEQAPNTEYWYYDGIGTETVGYPGWHKSLKSPGNKVKSHLVNFAPFISGVNDGASKFSGPFYPNFTYPAWRIYLVEKPADFALAGSRQCFLICHGNGDTVNMIGDGIYSGATYVPSSSSDDSWTY